MTAGIDRYWFLTWTTYGQWLPGDPRGSVTRVRENGNSHRVEHDVFQTPRTESIPGIYSAAQSTLKGQPVRLDREQALVLLEQFQETATYRRWLLVAVGIMANHIHIVVGVPGDLDPEDLLRDFKSYGSRAMNLRGKRPESGTWWTRSGSNRKLADEASVSAAVEYVRTQEFPLLIWINSIVEDWRALREFQSF